MMFKKLFKELIKDKIFLAALFIFISSTYIAVHAQEKRTNFYGKPVMCTPLEQAMGMWVQIKKDDMKPLLGFRGNSFLDDGRKFDVDYFILYDAEEQQIVVVERQDNGFQCLIAGGTGNVTFDPEKLNDLIGWDDIP